MIKKYHKRVLTLLIFVFLLVSRCFVEIHFSNVSILEESNSETVEDKIFETEEDIEASIYNQYGSEQDFSFRYEDKTGVLSVKNVKQDTLKINYNGLGPLRHDLNGDNIINDLDNVGPKGEGICQPTAVAMALRYMVYRKNVTYVPRLSSDSLDINNVFYEVAEAYISNGWTGGGAERSLCRKSLNTFFEKNNLNYEADYSTVNLLYFIESSHAKSVPAIGHIVGSDGAHAVTICGFFTIKIFYTQQWTHSNMVIIQRYAVINTGWKDSNLPDSGGSTLEEYYINYSYIDIEDLFAVTYIR